MAEAPEHIEKRNQVLSAMVSLGVHTIIILLMLYWTLSTPIPPYPEGGGGEGSGLEVNLGTSDMGYGAVQPEEINIPKEEPVQPKQTASGAPEKILTQDFDEEDAIEASPKKETKKTKPAPTTTPTVKKPVQTETTEKPAEKKVNLNPNAFYKPRTTNHGVAGGTGDQGKPNGSATAPTYTGQGKGGNGGSGAGGGTGGGVGTGVGRGTGPGYSFNLDGRSLLSLPKPEYTNQVEGDVVVEVTVDVNGKVIAANPGYKGSTTLDENLLQLAKKAALNARFDRKADAPAVQKGTITYKFRLQ
jgi:TonB family protein